MPERKFIDLKALKVSDEGSGAIEGYRSVFGEIDEGGDIVVKGAFAECIPEFLRSGFTAESHDWDFSKAVGFPVEAKEDDYGWFVKSQFHSTPDAQNIRIKAQERFAAGKQVGFSFGYKTDEYQIIEQKDFKDQLPLFISADRLAENMKKAQQFSRIRILKKVSAIEDSLVTAGMNKLAAATGVKSESKGMLADEMAQTTPSFWQVESAFCRVVRKIAETVKNGDVTGLEFDWKAKVTTASSELGSEAGQLAIDQIEEFLNSSDEEFYLKGIAAPESFESFEATAPGLSKFVQKLRDFHEIRLKEGRILSASNRAIVQAAYDALGALLVESEPKPKEKGIDVAALRIQAERISHSLMSLMQN
jgi:HK97 family phage prohead protease